MTNSGSLLIDSNAKNEAIIAIEAIPAPIANEGPWINDLMIFEHHLGFCGFQTFYLWKHDNLKKRFRKICSLTVFYAH